MMGFTGSPTRDAKSAIIKLSDVCFSVVIEVINMILVTDFLQKQKETKKNWNVPGNAVPKTENSCNLRAIGFIATNK